eukprot:357372-Chlamydomonas_euryale.AAC.1
MRAGMHAHNCVCTQRRTTASRTADRCALCATFTVRNHGAVTPTPRPHYARDSRMCAHAPMHPCTHAHIESRRPSYRDAHVPAHGRGTRRFGDLWAKPFQAPCCHPPHACRPPDRFSQPC